MIDQTRGASPQTHPEPQGSAAAQPRPATPFRTVLTNSNGETFELPPAWGTYKAETQPQPAAAPAGPPPQPTAAPVILTSANGETFEMPQAWGATATPVRAARTQPPAEPQVASLDDAWRQDDAAPPESAATVSVTEYGPNGEAAFVPPQAANLGNRGNVTTFAEGNEPTVWDLLDFVNPLQHIPVINIIYRELTGDKIGALPQIVGGAVIGGPIGAMSAVANVMVQEATGKDLGGHVMAMFNDSPEPPRGHIEITAPAPPEARTAAAVPAAQPAAVAPAAAPASAAAPAGKAAAVIPDKFVPYDQAPAHLVPAAQRKTGKTPDDKFKPAPQRAAAAPPVSASAHAMPSPAAVKKAAAAQGLQNSSHPLANPDAAATPEALPSPAPLHGGPRRAISASDSVQPAATPGNSNDFVNKFMSAMDKYDKASRLAGAQAVSATTTKRTE